MRHFLATSCVLSLTLIAGGCATKKYVRNTTAPVQAKVDQVGEQTQKQGQDIQENKTPDQDSRRERSERHQRRQGACRDCGQSRRRSHEPGQPGRHGVDTEPTRRSTRPITNLDQLARSWYPTWTITNWPARPVSRSASTNTRSTTQSKEEFDKLVANVGTAKRYFISVEGFTDKTGYRSLQRGTEPQAGRCRRGVSGRQA